MRALLNVYELAGIPPFVFY